MTEPTTPIEPIPFPTREPVITTATITAAVTALLALVVAFGLDLDQAQQAAILGTTAVAAPVIVSIVARRYVVPSAAVVERIDDGAVIAGEGSELPTGEYIRAEGSLNTHRADA